MAEKLVIETHTSTWRAVAKRASDGIEAARVKLEASGNPIEKTEFERGRIKAFREILALADAPQGITSVDPQY